MASAVLRPLLWLVDADNPDPVPEANDVTAGWIAALVFVFLILAVVLLARSFVKQLRKAQVARDAGVYGDEPAASGGESPQVPEGPATGPPTGPPRGAAPR
jgi:uncharacterized protein (DUF58 family)